VYVVDVVGVTVRIVVALPPAGISTQEEPSVELEPGDDVNDTVPLNPLTDVTLMVEYPLLPKFIVKDGGLADMV